MEVVAVDISGRHEVKGRYCMLCAVVSARISPRNILRVYEVRQHPLVSERLDLNVVADLIATATLGLEGVVLVERGDMYNLEQWRAQSILGREMKYPQSLGERLAVELAHHVSVAGRRLMVEP
ncbi:MAG: DUF2209 domain-containing protein [Methanosarcinales archaeon]|nr:DUF2209 domain-containing protein [Methanosarcinales archaeon]